MLFFNYKFFLINTLAAALSYKKKTFTKVEILSWSNCGSEKKSEENRLYLIFEFLSMDLEKYMNSLPPEKSIDSDLVRSYLYQITSPILKYNRRKVLHRDLKPQNLLIDKKCIIKVADFGLGRTFGIPVWIHIHMKL